MEMLGWRLCYGSSTSYLMTWLWIPHASSWSSTYECVGLLRTFHPLLTSRFTFQHLPAFVFCLFCVVVWFCCFGVFLFPVFALLCFWFLLCKCLGIPNSPRSLDLDDRQGLIARSAMQQKKKAAVSASAVPLPVPADTARHSTQDHQREKRVGKKPKRVSKLTE